MPSYSWRCTGCKKETDVIRTIQEYQSPPGEDDGPGLDFCSIDEKSGVQAHKWERYIASGSGKFILNGPGWARDGYR